MVESCFLHAALRYCGVKVRHVDLNRLIRLAPCEEHGTPRPGDYGYSEGTPPCWEEIDEGSICLDEACENCQATYPLLQERRELGRQVPPLAKKMYREFRKVAEQ